MIFSSRFDKREVTRETHPPSPAPFRTTVSPWALTILSPLHPAEREERKEGGVRRQNVSSGREAEQRSRAEGKGTHEELHLGRELERVGPGQCRSRTFRGVSLYEMEVKVERKEAGPVVLYRLVCGDASHALETCRRNILPCKPISPSRTQG